METPGNTIQFETPTKSKEKVSYLGVELEKAENTDNAPKKEQYADYIDNEFSLALQRDIATSWALGDSLLIEGGTSIGKTTTVRKMAADLGWEVHYVNLNGTTDASDLMGRYIPNPHKNSAEDPEYIFADGSVTSGLRQEEGKTKIIILDELNASSPANLIRLHEILDALERNGQVVLSEDASETIQVNKGKTHIIALVNPPGKGFMQREAFDPAQLRRWVYLKAPSELPVPAFNDSTDALFGTLKEQKPIPEDSYLKMNEVMLKPEELSGIPGMSELVNKYKEFHKAAKELVQKRKVAQDQPQPFSYDDRMEPRRVRDFVCRFYRGDINETFQTALRYYYSGKLLDPKDKAKFNELIRLVEVKQDQVSNPKRKPLGAPTAPENNEVLTSQDARKIFEQMSYPEGFIGEEDIENTFGIQVKLEDIPPIPYSREVLERTKGLNLQLVLQIGRTENGEILSIEKMEELNKGTATIKVLDPEYKFNNFYTKESPRLGWKLVSINAPQSMGNLDYMAQQRGLLELAKEKLLQLKGVPGLPKEYEQAQDELKVLSGSIEADIILGKDDDAVDKIKKLYVSNLCRERSSEIVYRMLINSMRSHSGLPVVPSANVDFWSNSICGKGFVSVREVTEAILLERVLLKDQKPNLRAGFSTMKL